MILTKKPIQFIFFAAAIACERFLYAHETLRELMHTRIARSACKLKFSHLHRRELRRARKVFAIRWQPNNWLIAAANTNRFTARGFKLRLCGRVTQNALFSWSNSVGIFNLPRHVENRRSYIIFRTLQEICNKSRERVSSSFFSPTNKSSTECRGIFVNV